MPQQDIILTTSGIRQVYSDLRKIPQLYRDIGAAQKAAILPPRAIDRAEKFAKALREIAAGYRDIAQAQQGVNFNTPGGGGGGRGGSGGGGASGARRFRTLLKGPAQRFAEASLNLQKAESVGSDAEVLDAQVRKQQAQRNLNLAKSRLNNPSHANLPGLLELFSSLNQHLQSGNLGGAAQTLMRGIMLNPGGMNIEQVLGGAAGGAEGAGAAAGAAGGLGAVAAVALPAALALGAAAAAAKGLEEVLKRGAAEIGEVRTARTLSGGSAADVAGLRSFGLGGAEGAGRAARLRERLGSDPMAMLYGGFVAPRPFGPANEAQILATRMEELRQIGKTQGALKQLVAARALEMDDLLDVINVSDRVAEARKREADYTGSVFDDRTLQNSRDLAASMTTFNNLMGDLSAEFAKPFIRDFLAVLEAVNEQLLGSGGLKGAAQGFGEGMVGIIGDAIAPGLGDYLNQVGKVNEAAQQAQDRQVAATNTNTDALQEAARAIKMGFLRGGPRAQAALPMGGDVYNMSRALESGALRRKAVAL